MSIVRSLPVGFVIPADDGELLESCTVYTFRSGKKGGQHVNKTDSAVRLHHWPSGIVVTCQRERSQYRNKMICLEKLRKRLEDLSNVPAERISTKVPAKEKRARIETKVRRSVIKQNRKPPLLAGE